MELGQIQTITMTMNNNGCFLNCTLMIVRKITIKIPLTNAGYFFKKIVKIRIASERDINQDGF